MHPHIDKFTRYHGNYSRSCVQNLFIFVGCIIQGKTINLYDLRDEVGKLTEKYKSKTESHYKRLTRFLVSFSIGELWASVLGFGLELLNKNDWSICYLDATEWNIGKFNVHVLVLAIDYQGIAIPIYFQVYAHKGVLSEKKRVDFLEKAAIGLNLQAKIIIADREFIGNEYFLKFQELEIYFISRIRKQMYKSNILGNRSYESIKKKALKKGKASTIIEIDNLKFRLWIVKNITPDPKEPLVYILTNILHKRNIPDLYRLRWRIEYLFKHLKTNGYNLEDLRIKDLHKIRLLLSMLVLAYILAILTAINQRTTKPVKKKTYQNQKNYEGVSVFKQGQSLLKQSFISLKRFLDIIQFIDILIKAPLPFNTHFVQ
jgi:hypothetical protein